MSWIKDDLQIFSMTMIISSNFLQEAEVALGPFNMNPSRNMLMDIVGFILLNRYRVLAARGRPTIDPWGFLLPLTPMVWMGTLTTLLGIMGMILVLRKYLLFQSPDIDSRRIGPFSCVRIILQQGKKRVHRHLQLNTYVFCRGVYQFCRNIFTNHSFNLFWSALGLSHLPYRCL